MRKINIITATFILGCSLIGLQSCTKEGAQGPTGNQGPIGAAGPALKGTLAGYVLLFDQYGSRLLTSMANVMVTIDNIHDTTYTDSTGKYEFQNLSTGLYNLTYQKTGFGTNSVFSQQFTGGGLYFRNDIRISSIPNFNVLGVRDSLTATDAFILDSVAPNSKQRSQIVFIGATPSVSANPTTYLDYMTKNINVNVSKSVIDIPFSDIINLGFVSGQTVYIASYGICTNFSNSSVYEDYLTGRLIFSSISSVPATTSFVLP